MQLITISGADPVARDTSFTRALQSAGDPDAIERFDGTAPGAAAALTDMLSCPGLFGPRIGVLDELGALLSADLAMVCQALDVAREDEVTVIARCAGAVPAAWKDVSVRVSGTLLAHPAPRPGRGAQDWVKERAQHHHIRLDGASFNALADRAADPALLRRVDTTLSLLAVLGLTSPSLGQVATLLGTSAAAAAPWALTDAIETADSAAAVAIASTLEPMLVLAVLTKRLSILGQLAEANGTAADACALGLTAGRPADKAASVARRLTPASLGQAWAALARADDAARRSEGPAGLLIAVAELTALLRAGGPRRSGR